MGKTLSFLPISCPDLTPAVTLDVHGARAAPSERSGRTEGRMTNYAQQPPSGANRGLGENPLADPSVRMILSMSPLDGSLRPLPAELSVQELANGAMQVSYPDGSVRELIPGAQGEGRMITTLADGTRIQSDLSMGEGQVTLASISSTGEKAFLSLNENGANMQRITSDGNVSNVIPESAPELVQSFREAEAFSQVEELREHGQFQANPEFGEWNNFGKPADWQPEQSWQPTQGNWQPDHNFQTPQYFAPQFDPGHFAPQFDPGFPQASAYMPPQQFGEWNNYGNPGEWQPAQNWQPPQQNWQPDYNFQPPQYFAPQFDQYSGGFNQGTPFMPPQGFAAFPVTDQSGFPVHDASWAGFAGGQGAYDGTFPVQSIDDVPSDVNNVDDGFDTQPQEETPQ